MGQGHLLVGGVAAGLDRPPGILAPLALNEEFTPGIPFRFTGDAAGIEAFYVFRGISRASVQFVNGMAASREREGEMEGSTGPTSKDWVVTNQLILDDVGAAFSAVAYFGGVKALDPAQEDLNSRYFRLAVSANKFFGPFEAQTGYVYANNSRLPTGVTSSYAAAKSNGNGYWFHAGYTVKPSYWTLFGRYEFLDPDRGLSDNGLQRLVLGSLLPVNIPEYLRLARQMLLTHARLAVRQSFKLLTARRFT